MYAKKGNELPIDTVVYFGGGFTDSISNLSVLPCKIGSYSWKDTISCIFDPNDGLWATQYARMIWKTNHELHPHASLFEILYKKLEI